MGVILEFRDIWVAFRGVERSRKGTQGPAACTRRVCPLQAGLGLEGRGGGGVCEGPSTPPPLPLRRLVRVKPPRRRRSPQLAGGGELQRLLSGAAGQRTSGLQLSEPDHPRACRCWGQVGRHPESHSGLEEFHSFSWG